MKKLRLLLIALFSLTGTSISVFAAEACYTPAQLQAEQLLRLHSELMVTTVTCREGSGGQPLNTAYGDFTHKNIRVLHDAEQAMMGYYREHQKGDPQSHLDRLRTLLANEFGQKVADMTAPEYCGVYRDRVLQYAAASPADVENEVERMKIADHSFVHECGAAKPSAAKKGN